jgi:hypothetical protein
MFHQQCRSDGIHGERLGQMLRGQLSQALLGFDFSIVEEASGVDHQARAANGSDVARALNDAGFTE